MYHPALAATIERKEAIVNPQIAGTISDSLFLKIRNFNTAYAACRVSAARRKEMRVSPTILFRVYIHSTNTTS